MYDGMTSEDENKNKIVNKICSVHTVEKFYSRKTLIHRSIFCIFLILNDVKDRNDRDTR